YRNYALGRWSRQLVLKQTGALLACRSQGDMMLDGPAHSRLQAILADYTTDVTPRNRRFLSMPELLAEVTAALGDQRACVYCSLVETRGSTPQKAGAAMLVFPDGSQRGTLGGGCVEAEVKQRALRVLAEDGDKPELLTFCLDDDYGWDDGLICGG